MPGVPLRPMGLYISVPEMSYRSIYRSRSSPGWGYGGMGYRGWVGGGLST